MIGRDLSKLTPALDVHFAALANRLDDSESQAPGSANIVFEEQGQMWILIGIVAILTVGIFWGGYVTSILWGWFMVPLGVKAISYWHAVGLGTLFSMFLGSRGLGNGQNEEAGAAIVKGLVCSVLIPLLCLAVGWLAKNNI